MAHHGNETALHRCIGLTIETRPDHCLEPQVTQIQALGGTRVELGVQTVHDRVLERIGRGHDSSVTRRSTRLVKDAGLKLLYHMMPGLPGSTPEMDLASFRTLFEDPAYRPDMLKIYPTLVVKGTELYDLWIKREYEPLSTEDAVELLVKVKRIIPPYVRIQRIQRDIPAPLIEAGVKKSNIRQLVHRALREEGGRCRCIRCREAGLNEGRVGEPELRELGYEASGGTEHFLSFEDPDTDALVAYLRLRIPGEASPNGREGRALVRELRVVGREVPLRGSDTPGPATATGGVGSAHGGAVAGAGSIAFSGTGVSRGARTQVGTDALGDSRTTLGSGAFGDSTAIRDAGTSGDTGWQASSGNGIQRRQYQHRRFGRRLLERAEEMTRDEGMDLLAVVSGVGVRPYYRELGYHRNGPYMERRL